MVVDTDYAGRPQFDCRFVSSQVNLLCVFKINQISFVAGAFLYRFIWDLGKFTCFHQKVQTDGSRSSGVPTQDRLTGRRTLLVSSDFFLCGNFFYVQSQATSLLDWYLMEDLRPL